MLIFCCIKYRKEINYYIIIFVMDNVIFIVLEIYIINKIFFFYLILKNEYIIIVLSEKLLIGYRNNI